MIPKPVKEENLGGANFGEESAEGAATVELNIRERYVNDLDWPEVEVLCGDDDAEFVWECTLHIYIYGTCRTREHEGRSERRAGTVERKSKGSPSSIDSRVEIVSTWI